MAGEKRRGPGTAGASCYSPGAEDRYAATKKLIVDRVCRFEPSEFWE
jgi:hypothetical protein